MPSSNACAKATWCRCASSPRAAAPGVRELLDVAERLFPHPGEGNPPPFVKGSGDEAAPIEARPDPKAHVIADVFKIVNDPFVGKLGIFRVYQGTVKKDTQLFVDDGKKPFKVAHLFKLKGKDHVEIAQAIPGDIAAVAKIDELHFDAVLHDSHDEDQIHLAAARLPQADVRPGDRRRAQGPGAEAGDRAAHAGRGGSLRSRWSTRRETNETVIRGLSDLHLRVILDRLKDRYGVEVTSRPPRIAYRETVGAQAEGHHRHKKQTGGAGQFGEVFLRIEPLPRGSGFEFVDEVKGGTIPGQFLPAVEKGVRQVLQGGAIAGYPIQDVRVTCTTASTMRWTARKWRSSPRARRRSWMRSAKARPQVLEPIVDLEVNAPEQHMGDISGGLASKRARISGTDSVRGGEIVVKAQVPLSELEGYAAELKSVTAGQGPLSRWISATTSRCRRNVQQRLVEAYKPRHEED